VQVVRAPAVTRRREAAEVRRLEEPAEAAEAAEAPAEPTELQMPLPEPAARAEAPRGVAEAPNGGKQRLGRRRLPATRPAHSPRSFAGEHSGAPQYMGKLTYDTRSACHGSRRLPVLGPLESNAVSIGKTCPPTGSCGDLRYCIAPHPEFDPSGKTLLVTWTDANVIHAVRIEWQ
jgi:hypothetical protein